MTHWRGRCLLGPCLRWRHGTDQLPAGAGRPDRQRRAGSRRDRCRHRARPPAAWRRVSAWWGCGRPRPSRGAGLAHAQASQRPVQRRPRSQWRGRADHRASTLGRRGAINAAAGGACRACRDQRSPPGRPSHPGRAANVAVFPVHGAGDGHRPTGRERPDPADRPDGGSQAAGSLFGRPLASDEEADERLSIAKALAVFSSDNLSSVAYATEAIMFTLLAAGTAAFWLTIPISIADRHRSSPSSSSPTDRPSAPTRTAAAATSSRARTSGSWPGSSRPRRCSSTTS